MVRRVQQTLRSRVHTDIVVRALALAVFVLAASGPSASAATDPCKLRGVQAVVQEGKVRVIEDPRTYRVYACFRGVRATPLILHRNCCASPLPEEFDIGGRYVAAIGSDNRVDGAEDDVQFVTVVDARRRKLVYTYQGPDDWSPYAVRVTRSGTLAWMESDPEWNRDPNTRPAHQIRVRDRDGERVLDHGLDVDPNSLALGGSRLYWIRGGIAKSAVLR